MRKSRRQQDAVSLQLSSKEVALVGDDMFSYHGNYQYGQWWTRLLGLLITLKAPWCKPLFSERYGIEKFVPLGFGWRFRIELA